MLWEKLAAFDESNINALSLQLEASIGYGLDKMRMTLQTIHFRFAFS